MARRPTPPSSSPRQTAPASKRRGARRTDARAARTPNVRGGAVGASADVREWASGIRLSAFSVIMLSLVVLGTWVLVPTLGTYIDQRQKITAMQESVRVSQAEIDALERELDRWDDPAYITTQARERLYYVKPGAVVYLVDNDLDPADIPPEQHEVSDEIRERPSDWMPQLLRSITGAGLAKTAVETPAD